MLKLDLKFTEKEDKSVKIDLGVSSKIEKATENEKQVASMLYSKLQDLLENMKGE